MKRLLLTLLWAGYSLLSQAQSPELYGGAGFFRLGYANLHRIGQTLDQFTTVSHVPIGNDFVYVGGEGYARLNKYVLGGGGYGMARHNSATATYRAEPFSGGGYLYIGRVVVDSRRFWLYPTIGAGMAMIGLTQREQQGQLIQESTVMLPSLNAQLGIGADWLMAAWGDQQRYGGLLMGIRAGYQFGPASSGWRSTDEVLLSDRPRYAVSGFFVTLTVGVGAFRRFSAKKTPSLQ